MYRYFSKRSDAAAVDSSRAPRVTAPAAAARGRAVHVTATIPCLVFMVSKKFSLLFKVVVGECGIVLVTG